MDFIQCNADSINNHHIHKEQIDVQWKSTENKVAMVTGAAQGIGAAIARAYAAQGAKVATGTGMAKRRRKSPSEIRKQGQRAIGVACDVSDRASTDAAVAEIAGKLGPVISRQQRRHHAHCNAAQNDHSGTNGIRSSTCTLAAASTVCRPWSAA